MQLFYTLHCDKLLQMNSKFYQLSKVFKNAPLSLLIKITGQNVIYPFYHAVSDYELIHIKHLYNVRTSKAFEKDLDFFLKYYKPIEYYELIDSITKNILIKKNSFLLSFDDGLSEFDSVIAPILKRKGIPAICFLNSAFIDNKDLFFRYKESVLLDKLKNSEVSSGLKNEIELWFKQRKLTYNDNYDSLLSINYLERNNLDSFAKLIGIDFNEYLQKYKPYLSTDQINSLIKQGFIFGSHSIDHPMYSYLDENEQILQTETSIKEITKKFNLNYRIFSFPFTDFSIKKSFFDKVLNKNNSVADLTFGCAGLKHDSCLKNIQRIPIEMGNFSAQNIIIGEYMYYILKAFLSKNIINRI